METKIGEKLGWAWSDGSPWWISLFVGGGGRRCDEVNSLNLEEARQLRVVRRRRNRVSSSMRDFEVPITAGHRHHNIPGNTKTKHATVPTYIHLRKGAARGETSLVPHPNSIHDSTPPSLRHFLPFIHPIIRGARPMNKADR